MMQSCVGIDFGTTNSAVAAVGPDGMAGLLPLPAAGGGVAETWRSLLYFEPGDRAGQAEVSAGEPAIARYAASAGDGRLLQSFKSHLASALFSGTEIFGRTWSIERLVATYLRQLLAAAGCREVRRAVVGRPVRYWGAQEEADEQRALERMRAALQMVGIEEVVFEFEPVAAAHDYAARSRRQELVLIADLGGGTSDFSLLQVGDGAPTDAAAVLATGGLGVGGDAFDARVIDQVVAPGLGKGSEYRDEFGAAMVVPPWIYGHLRRWHHLPLLKARKTLGLLERIRAGAREPARLDCLLQVIEHDLGLPLHRAVERAKVALSRQETTRLEFVDPPIRIDAPVPRAEFDGWIEPDLAAIDAVIENLLRDARIAAAAVDRVFATGGSSLVPAVRARLAARFGGDRLVGGRELTSVATGLALRAGQLFG